MEYSMWGVKAEQDGKVTFNDNLLATLGSDLWDKNYWVALHSNTPGEKTIEIKMDSRESAIQILELIRVHSKNFMALWG
jgi:hypothetical protein